MEPVTLFMLAFGGFALTRKKRRRSSSSSFGSYAIEGPEDRRAVLNEVRSMSFWVSDRYGMMPGLADYLTVVGYIESNFNPRAINKEIETNPNAARGLFGMRPETAFKDKNGLTHLRQYPETLFSVRWSFVAAVDDIARAATRTYEVGSGDADWVAERRWWNSPSLVHDFDESENTSKEVRRRLEEGMFGSKWRDGSIADYGLPKNPNFIWDKVRAENYPGIGQMLSDFSLNPNNPYAAVV